MSAMSPRPRLASDADILAAALRAMTRLGPVRLTLAAVAREAGLSPAALVQRFGSKRQLLLALAAQAPEGNDALFQNLRDANASHLQALLAMADCMAMMGSTPEEISNTLAFLQIDLTDPEFHRLALRSSGSVHAGIRALVKDAVHAAELIRCNADRLAHALHATMNGSLLNWAIHREGTLQAWIRRDLQTVLAPYVAPRGRQSRKNSRTRKLENSRNAG
jgi:AcrR family transcriptional regulator